MRSGRGVVLRKNGFVLRRSEGVGHEGLGVYFAIFGVFGPGLNGLEQETVYGRVNGIELLIIFDIIFLRLVLLLLLNGMEVGLLLFELR